MDDLLLKEKTCPLCGVQFKSAKVKRSRQYMLKRDTDFCTFYKGKNPAFYNVYVCPECGYGFSDNSKTPTSEEKNIFKEKIKNTDNLCGLRTVDEAIIACQTTLECALMVEERREIVAGLYLHLAWFNRFKENKDGELKYLEKALEYYEKAIELDRDLENPATILYLIGELSSRLGDEKKAIKYFAYIVNDKKINNPNIIRMARERWQEIRELKRQRQ